MLSPLTYFLAPSSSPHQPGDVGGQKILLGEAVRTTMGAPLSAAAPKACPSLRPPC